MLGGEGEGEIQLFWVGFGFWVADRGLKVRRVERYGDKRRE